MSAAVIPDPSAPSLVWPYQPARRAVLLRTTYLSGPTAWTETAGVRACDVLGLDDKPAAATRALVEFREGKQHRKTWVALADLASTPAAAAKKLAPHLSALLATRAPSKMAVKTVASGADEPFLPVPAGYCPECWKKGRSSGLTASSVCAMAHTHDVAPVSTPAAAAA